MKKPLVICGPTAVGKTGLGIKLAKKFKGEIVSADSRQIYKGMDIGTGKEILNIKYEKLKTHIKNKKFNIYEIKDIPIWLWDVVEPDYQFSVADYVSCANLVMEDIWKRGKMPILVGGTGFYIKGMIDGIETMGVGQDQELRKKLQNSKTPKLQKMLKNSDPERWERMNQSDRKNPRRLIRAIEIAIANEKFATQNTQKKYKEHRIHRKDVLMIGLMVANEILYKRIDKRVDERVEEGIVEEIKGLLKKGYSWENSVLGQTIGYKEWRGYFTRTLDHENTRTKLKEEIIQKWKYDEHGYARRQMTWFKKNKRVNWFDISHKGWENDLMSFLRKQESI